MTSEYASKLISIWQNLVRSEYQDAFKKELSPHSETLSSTFKAIMILRHAKILVDIPCCPISCHESVFVWFMRMLKEVVPEARFEAYASERDEREGGEIGTEICFTLLGALSMDEERAVENYITLQQKIWGYLLVEDVEADVQRFYLDIQSCESAYLLKLISYSQDGEAQFKVESRTHRPEKDSDFKILGTITIRFADYSSLLFGGSITAIVPRDILVLSSIETRLKGTKISVSQETFPGIERFIG